MSHTISNNSDHPAERSSGPQSPMVWKNGGHLFSQKSNGHSHAIPQTCFCDYHAVGISRKGAGADTLSQRGGYIFILHGYRNYLMCDKEEIGITDLLLDRDKLSKV